MPLARSLPVLVPVLLAVGLALLPGPAQARQSAEQEDVMLASYAYRYAHPDVGFRRKGLAAYDSGDAARAFRYFLDASRYADEPSQAMIAAMLWNGDGVARDRAAAYAWMDLAAERRFPAMLARRERYWHALDESERRRAIEQGPALYLEYGDLAAKERHRRHLRRVRNTVTGSRVGFAGRNLKVTLNVEGEPFTVYAHDYYHPQWWQPKRYWAMQYAEWSGAGRVEIGPLRREEE